MTWISNHIQQFSVWRNYSSVSQFLTAFELIPVNTLWPSDAIWRDRYGSTLPQVVACYLRPPNHYLSQWCLLISKIPWHSPDSNVTGNAAATALYNEVENYTLQLFPLLSGSNEAISVGSTATWIYLDARSTPPTRLPMVAIATARGITKEARPNWCSANVWKKEITFDLVKVCVLSWFFQRK